MDLGFGAHNQEIGQATASALLRGAEAQEQTLEAELHQFDRLMDDEDALEDLRQKRLKQLQTQHARNKKYKELGHGTYTELSESSPQGNTADVAKAFFETTKQSDRAVVHFYRPSTRSCDVFHAHLAKLAPKHLETKFVKINVEGCDQNNGGSASFLVERLGVVVMPTLVLIKDRKVIHQLRGFDQLGGSEGVSVQTLAHVLGTYGVTDMRDDEEVSEEVLKAKGINTIRITKGAKKGIYDDDHEE